MPHLMMLLLAAVLAAGDRRFVAIADADAYWTWSSGCAPERVTSTEQPCGPTMPVEIRTQPRALLIWGTEAMLRELPDALLPSAHADEKGLATIRVPPATRVFARVAGPAIASAWTVVAHRTEIAALPAVVPKFRIRDAAGREARGARVELRTADVEGLPFRGSGDGEVTIPPIPAGHTLRILAWSATGAPTIVTSRELPPTIELRAGHVLRGAIETDGGKPAANAAVTGTSILPGDRAVLRRKAAADAAGRFVLAGLPDAFVTWTASLDGFAAATGVLRVDKDDDLGAIVLRRPRTVLVRVTGEDGRAIPGARVVSRSGESSTTGSDGVARMPGVPMAEVIAFVSAPSHLKQEVAIPADAAEVDVQLVPSASVRARIVRANGGGPAGPGTVSIVLDSLRRLVELDGHGALVVDDLPAGKLTLEIRAADAAPLRLPPRDLGKGETVDLGRIEVDGGIAVTGRVIDAAGTPLAGVVVRALRPGADPPLFAFTRRDWVTAESQDDGTFAVRGLAPGVYALWTESRGHAPLVRTGLIVAEESRLTGVDLGDLALPAARMVSVQCTPVPRCGSEASIAVEGADWLSVSAPMAEGRAAIGPVAAGPALLRLVERHRAVYDGGVTVSGGEPVTTVRLDLSGVTVRGRVTRGGRATGGGSMLCSTMRGEQRPIVQMAHSADGFAAGHEIIGVLPREISSPVDADGRFELRDLTAGEYQLTWIHEGRRSLPRGITIGNTKAIDLHFELPEGAIDGIVRVPNEPARRRVAVVVEQNGRTSEIMTWTGERFSIAGLDPGPAHVRAREAGAGDPESAEARVTIADREPVFVELTLTRKSPDELRVIVRRDDGMPAANAFVFARQGGHLRLATTDGEGRASFRMQGPAGIAVYAPSHGWTFSEGNDVIVLRRSAASLVVSTEGEAGNVELWSANSFPIHQALASLGIAPTARRAIPLRVTGLPRGHYRVVMSGESKSVELRDETRNVRF